MQCLCLKIKKNIPNYSQIDDQAYRNDNPIPTWARASQLHSFLKNQFRNENHSNAINCGKIKLFIPAESGISYGNRQYDNSRDSVICNNDNF